MPPRRASSPRFRVILAAACLVTVALPGLPASAAPPYTMEERASAIASPALVLIEARTEGFLRSKPTGQILHEEPISLVYRCNGFGVGAPGYAVSMVDCVLRSHESLHKSAALHFANRLIRDEQLVAEQKDAYVDTLLGTSSFTMSDSDTFPETNIYGQVFRAWGGLVKSPAFSGQVVTSDSASNIALLKFEYEDLPIAEIGSNQLEIGKSVVLAGFETTDTAPSTAAYTVNSRSVKITGRLDDDTPPQFVLDGDIGDYSHGGMVLNSSGQVIGVIDDDPTVGSRVNQIAVSTEPLNELLTAAKVANELTERDRLYRAGLDSYFAGRYAEAIERLDKVTAAVPAHSVAAQYRQHASERLAVEGAAEGSGAPWALIVIIVLAALIVILIAVLIFVLVRRRPVETPVSAAPYNWPVSGVPISAAPVSGYGYEETTIPAQQQTWQQSGFHDPLSVPTQQMPTYPGMPPGDPAPGRPGESGSAGSRGTDPAPS